MILINSGSKHYYHYFRQCSLYKNFIYNSFVKHWIEKDIIYV